MEITVKINLETKDVQVLSMKILSPKIVVDIVCNYFGISPEELIVTPSLRGDEYQMSKKYIAFFLRERNVPDGKIAKILGYSQTSYVQDILTSLVESIHKSEEKYLRPMVNLKRILTNF